MAADPSNSDIQQTSSTSTRPLPPTLPSVTRHITTHSPVTGAAILHSSTPGAWTTYDDDAMRFNVVYTTSRFPVALTPSDADIAAHESLTTPAVAADGTRQPSRLGLVNPGGSVLRMVDMAPGYECMMHRTQSLDYGIVLEGSVEMILDSGETVIMRRGDVAVQRATMHAWRNVSSKDEGKWARMIFVLQDAEPVVLGNRVLGEDLGKGTVGIPMSGMGRE
ncbi:MAG: hypothetical protein M1827_003632 [Pycnora praestabilis]|nr:MAG: hypothetical protein M1827_003632 [Pycnora praestabilis]